jgi:hypothetical protein
MPVVGGMPVVDGQPVGQFRANKQCAHRQLTGQFTGIAKDMRPVFSHGLLSGHVVGAADVVETKVVEAKVERWLVRNGQPPHLCAGASRPWLVA